MRSSRRLRSWILPAFAGAFLLGLVFSGRFLVVNQPRPADAIVVMAGETEARPARAVELASQGYARQIVLNVPDWAREFGHPVAELARDWAKQQPVPVLVCVTHGLSTKTEALDTGRCLDAAGAKSVLIVTSDFHTRRALSVLRRELPGHQFSVAAASNPREFGVNWWQQREWVKTNFYEWMRLAWWELVDRWG